MAGSSPNSRLVAAATTYFRKLFLLIHIETFFLQMVEGNDRVMRHVAMKGEDFVGSPSPSPPPPPPPLVLPLDVGRMGIKAIKVCFSPVWPLVGNISSCLKALHSNNTYKWWLSFQSSEPKSAPLSFLSIEITLEFKKIFLKSSFLGVSLYWNANSLSWYSAALILTALPPTKFIHLQEGGLHATPALSSSFFFF